VSWVFGHIVVQISFDPPQVKLSEVKDLGRFLEHNLPEVEHDLCVLGAEVLDNVAVFVDQIAICVYQAAFHIHSLACLRIRL